MVLDIHGNPLAIARFSLLTLAIPIGLQLLLRDPDQCPAPPQLGVLLRGRRTTPLLLLNDRFGRKSILFVTYVVGAVGVIGLAQNQQEGYMKFWFCLIGIGISPFLNNTLIYISEIGSKSY